VGLHLGRTAHILVVAVVTVDCEMNVRCSNHVLTNFLSSLRPPHVDPLVRDLVIGSLVACPDVLHWYLPSIRHMCLPRPTHGCLAMLQFIRQVEVNVSVCFILNMLVVALAAAAVVGPFRRGCCAGTEDEEFECGDYGDDFEDQTWRRRPDRTVEKRPCSSIGQLA